MSPLRASFKFPNERLIILVAVCLIVIANTIGLFDNSRKSFSDSITAPEVCGNFIPEVLLYFTERFKKDTGGIRYEN